MGYCYCRPTSSNFHFEWKRSDFGFRLWWESMQHSLILELSPPLSPLRLLFSSIHPHQCPPPLTHFLFICPIWRNKKSNAKINWPCESQDYHAVNVLWMTALCGPSFFSFLLFKISSFFKKKNNNNKLILSRWLLFSFFWNHVKGLLTESMWLVLWYSLSPAANLTGNKASEVFDSSTGKNVVPN